MVVALLQGISGDESGEEPWKTTIICLAMGGKFAIAGAYAVIYMFSTEQFPTCIKNSGLGVCSFSARIGGLLCPYVISLGKKWQPLPLIIFGAVSMIAAFLIILLPETHKKHLPRTLEEGEKFGSEEASTNDEKKLLNA